LRLANNIENRICVAICYHGWWDNSIISLSMVYLPSASIHILLGHVQSIDAWISFGTKYYYPCYPDAIYGCYSYRNSVFWIY
jgi:hypothetical protein